MSVEVDQRLILDVVCCGNGGVVFREQNNKMLRYDQEEVGIESVFCCPAVTDSLFEEEEDTPYAEACQILREINFIVVPSDMLFCLWRTGRAIYDLAQVCHWVHWTFAASSRLSSVCAALCKV
jgi:hypothetical protein|eukprot:COSAG01_NODE_3631_length_5847_cov_18.156228_2_plen_123_part_00